MIPAAVPPESASRSVFNLTEAVLRLALSAALPVSAVVFVVLSF